MKKDTTATTLNQRRTIRTWAMAAVLFLLVAVNGSAWGQSITNLIYQDNFERSGLLNGSTPDTDATGAKYVAGPLIWTGNWTDQNGNTENACFFSNALPTAVQGPLYNVAYLPITVETGHVYTASCSILVNTNYTVWWMFLAYDTVDTLNAVQGNWVGGMLIRSTNNPGTGSGNFQVFTGGGTGGGKTYNFTPTSLIQPNFVTYTTVLNLADPNNLTEIWYTNGVAIRTNDCGTSLSGVSPNNGIWPRYLTFGQSNCGGYVTNFNFTDVIPVPYAPNIVEQPNNLTAAQGQTATFWVNAVGTPDPTYQWMSNNVAIAGATNATYTTPPLSSSYNGTLYSVQVANVAATITSSSATLTVTAGHPTVYSVTKTASPTTIVVNFSSALDPITSQNAANYSLNNGASVISVSPGGSPGSVILTTSALDPTLPYSLTVNNVQDSFGDAMAGASTNAVLPAGLVLDLKGDSGVELDSNGNVVEWMDQTTNGNNASQFFGWRPSTSGLGYSGATTRPATNVLINGLQTLTFNAGSDTFLQAAPTPSVGINSNLTIYCVAKATDASVNRHLISKNVGNQAGSYEFDANSSAGALQPNLLSGSGGSGTVAVAAGSTIAFSTPHVFAATRQFVAIYTNAFATNALPPAQTNWYYTQSNSVSVYLDGVPTKTNAAVNEGAPGCIDSAEPVYIGTREDHYASDIMNGQIAEILVFNTVLSPADMTNVDNYLGQKWFNGVTFATAVPSITTSNGFSVTISPGPSSGSTHLSGYQWQENGTNIPGAVAPVYNTPILAPSDNGDTFTLIVTLFNGTSFTNTTSLNVLNEPPYVTSAGIPIWNTNQIIVFFDEAVDPATATIAGNYTLNNGANVLSAAIGSAANEVVLTTSALTWNGNPGFYALTVSNVKDSYGNTIATASPPVGLYPPAVALWAKADTGVTADGSGNVSQWNDLSGNNNPLITVSAVSPLLITNANGSLAIHFAATNDTEMDAVSSPTLAITGDLSIIAAMRFATLVGGTNGEIVSKTGSGAQANIPAPYDYSVGSANAGYLRGNGGSSGNGTSYGSYGAAVGPVVGVPQILAVSESGNTVSHFVNGEPAGVGLLSNNYQESKDADQGNDLTIGARGDNHNRLTGDISELVVIGSSISAGDLASLDNYLAAKYRVVLFSQSPTNIAFSASGAKLTLSWPADHTGWLLQAQTNSVAVGISNNWVNVSGSTLTNQVAIPINLTNGTVFYRLVYP
ncbi:MAG TPA: immunoglobulin domain-containing protein [Verrucomicrobiae bacterium]|nr:immunoglobulin domain-containing protein [Verrucomicrobiae bacterium]